MTTCLFLGNNNLASVFSIKSKLVIIPDCPEIDLENSITKELAKGDMMRYEALRDVDGGNVGQFEHTVIVTDGGPEVLTVL